MKCAVFVNGVPASGKSTVSRDLSLKTGWPLFALDTVKEALFEEIGRGDRDHNRRMGRASYRAIFDLIADCPDGMIVIIDAWFSFQPRAVLEAHIARSGLGRIAEIWCHAPAEEIGARYARRVGARSAGHLGLDYVPELIELARSAKPLGDFDLLKVDTTLAAPDVASWARKALQTD